MNILQGSFGVFELVAQVFDSRKQRLNVFTLTLGYAYALGTAIALAAQGLGFNLQRLASLFERQVTFGIERKAAASKVLSNLGCGLSQ